MPINIRRVLLFAVLCCCMVSGRARAQQQQPPEDPEDDKKLGLWLDQGISSGLTPSKSLEIEFHERSDEVISNFYEYFVQGGIAFRVRSWLTVTPLYRYQRSREPRDRLREPVATQRNDGHIAGSVAT